MGARDPRLLEVLVVFAATLLAIRGVVAVGQGVLWDLPLVLVPVLFMWAPVWVLRARGVDPDRYPLALPPLSDRAVWGDALRVGGLTIVVVTVPYVGLYHLWQTWWFPEILQGLCDAGFGTCGAARRAVSFGPTGRLPTDLLQLVAYHLLFVAVPEELFYRGYMQSRLDEVWPPRWRILGATLGPGWLLTCVLFAAGHSVVTVQWWHFAIMFPSLVFGWLRARTGHILASALFHAWANVMVAVLDVAWGLRPP